MYGCESWTMKKAEHQRIDSFELWCWRRLLRVPWTVRRLNQSILKEINPEYSLEGLMLKLKLQYFGYLMRRTDSFEKTLMLGKTEVRRRRGWQRIRWLDGITNSMDMGLHGLQELVMDREASHAAVHRVAKSWARLSDWTELSKLLVTANISSPIPSHWVPWTSHRTHPGTVKILLKCQPCSCFQILHWSCFPSLNCPPSHLPAWCNPSCPLKSS